MIKPKKKSFQTLMSKMYKHIFSQKKKKSTKKFSCPEKKSEKKIWKV